LATSEKPFVKGKILSLLHQAVVEIVTLRDSALFTLSFDLSHVTYPAAVLASISNTTIHYDDINKQIFLKYEMDGEQSILQAIAAVTHTPGSHVSTLSTSKNAEVGAKAEKSDLSGNPTQALDKTVDDGQMMETTLAAQDINKSVDDGQMVETILTAQDIDKSVDGDDGQMMETTLTVRDVIKEPTQLSKPIIESEKGQGDGVEELPTQKYTSDANPYPTFVEMPFEPLDFRFAVSLLDSNFSDFTN
jgi:hypothetical protein